MNQIVYFSVIVFLILLLISVVLCNKNISEAFTNNLGRENTKQKTISDDILLACSYPTTGRNTVSNENARDMWWHYPIFEVGSYDQITNNLKYQNNPDVGRCTPANFCGALYKEYQTQTNYTYPLPPVGNKPIENSTRVNYYYAGENRMPFENSGNILY